MKRGVRVIEVRPKGYMDESGSDVTLNRQGIRSKFECTTLCTIDAEGGF